MRYKGSQIAMAIAAVGVITAATTACGDSGSSSGDFLGFSSPVMAQEGQKFIAQGLESATADLGWQTQVYDANLSTDTQVSNIQTMVDRPVTAIAAWALDEGAISGAYARAESADIPVVGVNSGGEGVDTIVWTEATTCEDGGVVAQVAQLFADAKPGGNIAIMSGPPAPSIVSMTECFSNAAKALGLNIIAQQDNTADTSAGASTLAQDMLSANPNIEGFWAYNDATALGIASVLQSSGKTAYTADNPSGIVVTGSNGDTSAITAVRNGTITATVETDPVCTGYTIVAATRDAAEGKTQAEYVVKSNIVDSQTVADYVSPEDRTCSFDDLPLVK
ncbi:sugar ABC transporter substrate-binding protein [Williamsia sp.]|uniref:sugar ABC transporter substrate-binding protein n=1 Tax=Williamsia sp. TaxID=1872085 RepID=UPI002F92D34F